MTPEEKTKRIRELNDTFRHNILRGGSAKDIVIITGELSQEPPAPPVDRPSEGRPVQGLHRGQRSLRRA